MIQLLHRLNQTELPICLLFNRLSHKNAINRFFAVISRLGDGVFWYTLLAVICFAYGNQGIVAALHMLLTAAVVLLVYKLLKTNTHRIRPYRYSDSILQNVAALDQFSFPSGHTMHAVSFSVVLLHYFPHFVWIVVPFAILVALSRLVLGLHYPSDVLIGFLLGGGIAIFSIDLF